MSWISALSPTNFASLSGARIAALRTEDFKALTKAQLGAMTADQIGAIEPIDMAVLTADKVAAFNPQALADGLVIYESNNPAGLPSKQMAALTGVQINKFSAELVSSLLPKMTAAQIGSISTTAIPRLGSSISTLSAAQLVGFTPLQKAVFTTAQNVAFSVEQLKNVGRLSPAQISAIDPSLISSIGNSAISNSKSNCCIG